MCFIAQINKLCCNYKTKPAVFTAPGLLLYKYGTVASRWIVCFFWLILCSGHPPLPNVRVMSSRCRSAQPTQSVSYNTSAAESAFNLTHSKDLSVAFLVKIILSLIYCSGFFTGLQTHREKIPLTGSRQHAHPADWHVFCLLPSNRALPGSTCTL